MTQNEALAIMEVGENVLLTGAAGSGKTYTLAKFIKRAREDDKAVAVTATTGLAATHLNGVTIHAWAGIGIHDELPKKFFQKMSKQRKDIIAKTDVLVIDEISMLHDFRLDLVEEVCRKVREDDRPFGGVQVIMSGDFFQLPPVNRNDSKHGSFVTSSQVWQDGHFQVCYLEEQHRQTDDTAYTDILNGIRAGVLMRSQLDTLMARTNAIGDPFLPSTRLHTTNADVDAINAAHLAELEGEAIEYVMTTSGSKKFVEQLQRSCLAPEVLQLKVGAAVMCIKNSPDKRYVNGSLGVVESFDKETNLPVITLTSGRAITIKPESWELVDGDKKRAELSQLPLRLAWAITVHKSQGMTLDAAHIDLRRAFVEGMGYVALSRVRGLKHLVLDGINGMALKVSPLAKELDKELRMRSQQSVIDHEQDIADWVEAEKTRPKEKKPKKKASGAGWSEKIEKMREQYPNAYRPWSEKDDAKLTKLFKKGSHVSNLTDEFGRHPGSIKMRVKKLFGEDATIE